MFPSVLVVLFASIIPGGPAALAANQSEIVAAMVAGWNLGNQLEAIIDGDGYTTITGGWLLVNSTDQTTIKTKYQKVWQQIASAFAEYDERLIFESMNEVFDGTWSTPASAYYANLNDYNPIFVNTVRQTGSNNTARWLLIPGWNTNIDYTAGDYGFLIPTDDYRSSSIPSSEKG